MEEFLEGEAIVADQSILNEAKFLNDKALSRAFSNGRTSEGPSRYFLFGCTNIFQECFVVWHSTKEFFN